MRPYANAEDGTRVNGYTLSSAKKIVFAKITSIKNQNGSVKVSWTKVSGVAGYKVYRKISGEDKYTCIKTIKKSSTNYYVDSSSKAVKNGKASGYCVKPYYKEDNGYVLQTDKKTNLYLSRTSISSISGAKKALTVKWKKNSKATGYQIIYSRSKSFDSYERITVKDKDTLSKKIKSLASKKTYYVKVRSYRTYKDVNYYSAWSAAKSVKTK